MVFFNDVIHELIKNIYPSMRGTSVRICLEMSIRSRSRDAAATAAVMASSIHANVHPLDFTFILNVFTTPETKENWIIQKYLISQFFAVLINNIIYICNYRLADWKININVIYYIWNSIENVTIKIRLNFKFLNNAIKYSVCYNTINFSELTPLTIPVPHTSKDIPVLEIRGRYYWSCLRIQNKGSSIPS